MEKVVDLFAGCGGMSLGLEMAGFETVYVNELHPRCNDNLSN
jgi:DNA (cytosine-5)-methyltransferase 1